MVTKYKGKLLKNKKEEGELLKDTLPEGEILKNESPEGNPLWKTPENLNEKKKYKKQNLNE